MQDPYRDVMDEFRDTLSDIKKMGILNHRFTKRHTLSKEWKYYINLEGEECRDIDFKYANGRVCSDVIEKLGLLEDILEKIPINQLMALMKTKG